MPGQDSLSIIIPVTDYETEVVNLLDFLKGLSSAPEIIVVYPDILSKPPSYLDPYLKFIKVISSTPGRASQLNAGARHAGFENVLFLHADTRFSDTFDINPDSIIQHVISSLESDREALFYFDIEFYGYHKVLMMLNGIGANLRSRVLKIPFGDQGFGVSKKQFLEVAGYPEELPYGEDHVFVWRIRQAGGAIKPFRRKIYTSARKYKEKGWLYITVLYQYLWIKQALPEWIKLITKK